MAGEVTQRTPASVRAAPRPLAVARWSIGGAPTAWSSQEGAGESPEPDGGRG